MGLADKAKFVEHQIDNLMDAIKEACIPHSFTSDTLVLMADGSSKRIANIRVGDRVSNSNPDSSDTEQHEVTAIHVTEDDREFVELSIRTLVGVGTLVTTEHHLFWEATMHAWVEAGQLVRGDQLDSPGARPVSGEASHRRVGYEAIYDLTVDGVHTYYALAGGEPALVHNAKCTSIPSSSTDEFAVIGRVPDVEEPYPWRDHEVLNLEKWSEALNDQWVQGIVDSRQKVYVASQEAGNMTNKYGKESVFSRELKQLRDAGYTRSGDYMLPPA